jgi:hypothetical protein
MGCSGSLLAWVEHRGDSVVVAIRGALATERRPASRHCSSYDEARHWAEREAKAVGLPVEWLGNDTQVNRHEVP